MSCTRAKESPVAIYSGGATGQAVRIGRQRGRFLLPGGTLRFVSQEAGDLVATAGPWPGLSPNIDIGAEIRFATLGDDATPAELYS